MSLFIAGLAFEHGSGAYFAGDRLGILIGSGASAVAAALVLLLEVLGQKEGATTGLVPVQADVKASFVDVKEQVPRVRTESSGPDPRGGVGRCKGRRLPVGGAAAKDPRGH